MSNTLLIFNNNQVTSIEIPECSFYPYISQEILKSVKQQLTPNLEIVLKAKDGQVLLNCLGNDKDRQAVQNLIKQEKKEKRQEIKIEEHCLMNNLSSITTINSDSYSQFFELAALMANNLYREQELKDLILEKSSLVEKLVEELKQYQDEFNQIKEMNSKFREFSQDTRLSETLKILVKVSEEAVNEAE